MSRRRPGLSEEMSVAWLQVGDALSADDWNRARSAADAAMDLSGWEPFRLAGRANDLSVRICELLPVMAAYHGAFGRWDHALLIHPDARDWVLETIGLGPMLKNAVSALGTGLVPLDEALAAVLHSAMTVPDDLSDWA